MRRGYRKVRFFKRWGNRFRSFRSRFGTKKYFGVSVKWWAIILLGVVAFLFFVLKNIADKNGVKLGALIKDNSKKLQKAKG